MNISAVITGHHEGLLAGPSIASYLEAAAEATSRGLSVELVVVLDRPDEATRAMFLETPIPGSRVHITDYGDPGLARNKGVDESRGDYVSFLDADDLWSYNWLSEAFSYSESQAIPFVAHSEVNVTFGGTRNIWLHADSLALDFDPSYLAVGNYWDAMSFAPRKIYAAHPFVANDLAAGYGHEDWHWNCVTLLHKIAHRPVPGTVHMKRRRANSQMARCAESDVVPWRTDLTRYEGVERLRAAAEQTGNHTERS